ncbi:ATP-binding protein [Pseudomonas oryzihabitans]|uniref:ATP-binding protein n=1 Tax=Pseudomonas oryzihabitans TaxID=47885 RepID=UPI001122FB90|nr:ATP-binding protein [Pseudomonas psychrotolerans]QDD89905.1 ATP-binding protein [Pseudomonas psychrotolerans]
MHSSFASSAKGRRAFSLTLLAGVLALGLQTAQARSSFEAPDPDYHGEIKASPAAGTAILAGSEVALEGRGFKPGQQITLSRGGVTLNPDAAYVADAQGNFKATIRIPEDAAPGQHPIVVSTAQPSGAAVFPLKVSPVVPLSSADAYSLTAAKLVPGLYQVGISAKTGALFVTSAVGRPPVKVSQLLKLDPKDLSIERQITPAAAPGEDAGVFAVYGVGVDDRNGTVWTTNTRQNTVAVYRQKDLGLVKQFAPGTVPHAHTVVIDDKLDRAFASAAMTPDIVSFDAKTPAVRKRISIESGVRGERFAVVGLSLDPAVHKLYAVSLKTNEAAVIDAKTEKVEKVFPIQGAKTPMSVAHDPQTDRLFIAAQGSDNLLIVDAKTGQTLHNVTTGAGALNVVFDPVKRLAYVTNRGAGTLTVVDPDGNIKANLELGTYPNHAVVDSKGVVYAVNKAKGQDDAEGDRITRVVAK